MAFFPILILAVALLFSPASFAQSQKGTVINDQVMVYQDASFDSPVISTVHVGAVFDMSTKTRGAFYKVRLKPGTMGWIADNDIKPGINKSAVRFAENRKNKRKATAKKSDDGARRKKNFEDQRYRGMAVEMIQFAEDTMGRVRSENLSFFGLKFAGPNTLFDGEMQTDTNFLFHVGAPAYYGITGNSANGWIIMANFLFQNQNTLSRDMTYFYGFGPMFRFSHFDLALNNAGKTTAYSAEDMALGAVFDLGLAVRVKRFSIRGDAKYYWEKQKYTAFGVSLLMDF